MKKVLLSSLAMVFAFCLTAQRTVDLAVDEIIKPTMLNSTYVGNSAGTTVESQFVYKEPWNGFSCNWRQYICWLENPRWESNNKFPKCQ